MKLLIAAAVLSTLVACSDSKDSKDSAPETSTNAPVIDTPAPTPEAPAAVEVALNASAKGVWVYYALKDNTLVATTKDAGDWIIGVSRYMFQTNTGSSGPHEGGAYMAAEKDFDAITTCDAAKFKKDEVFSASGYTASVNVDLTIGWFDPVMVTPLDQNYLIGRDAECMKMRILTYDAGLYTIKIQRI